MFHAIVRPGLARLVELVRGTPCLRPGLRTSRPAQARINCASTPRRGPGPMSKRSPRGPTSNEVASIHGAVTSTLR